MKKVCVVTGGGSGIGFAAAKEAAKKGYYVMIVGRNEKKLAGAVEELRKDGCEAEAYSCDVSDREHCVAGKNARVLVLRQETLRHRSEISKKRKRPPI